MRWKKALEEITPTKRYHVSKETDEAFQLLQKFYPEVALTHFSTGTIASGWEVPKAWELSYAALTDRDTDEILLDLTNVPLAVAPYSPSVKEDISFSDLVDHAFFDKHRPDKTLFSFRSQYRFWDADWEIALPYNQLVKLEERKLRVEINVSTYDHHMTQAFQKKQGISDETFLLIGHFDHPYQAGDGLIGCLAAHEAISRLSGDTFYSYAALSAIEIVGSVFFTQYFAKPNNVKEGLFCATSGINADIVFAKSFYGKSILDTVIQHILSHSKLPSNIVGFRESIGNDEIAFEVDGVDIPCCSLTRWPYEHYHTTDDTADKISEDRFEEFVELLLDAFWIIENNYIITRNYDGLPQLHSKAHNLYFEPKFISGMENSENQVSDRIIDKIEQRKSFQYDLSQYDFSKLMIKLPRLINGENTILDIANETGIPFPVLYFYLTQWRDAGLVNFQRTLP